MTMTYCLNSADTALRNVGKIVRYATKQGLIPDDENTLALTSGSIAMHTDITLPVSNLKIMSPSMANDPLETSP